MSKRIKHVFANSGEVAHIWAQQCQEWGRNPTENIYFSGDTIYSYGGHFPIAKFHKMPNGKTIVLYNDASYSNTTSGHQWDVLSAVKGQLVTRIPEKFWFNYIAGKEYFIQEIKDSLLLSSKATKYALSYLEQAGSLVSKLHKWGKLHKRHAFYKFTESELEILQRAKAQKARLAKQAEIKAAKDEVLRLERIRVLNEECGGDVNAYWRKFGLLPLLPHHGNYFVQQYLDGTLCRVVGDEVITSMNAKVPIKHAKRLLKIVYRVVAARSEYKMDSNHPIHIGYYSVNSITADGDVKIGCHEIKWSEVQLLGKQLLPELFGE